MKPISIGQAAAACHAEICGIAPNTMVQDVVIDGRKATPGALYVAIQGETFDGHAFARQAMENGAICILASKPVCAPHLLVKDTVSALQAIAGFYKSLFSAKTIGITGSVGKTTTKEMIAQILSQSHCVLKSAGNLNGQTGVPLNLFRLQESHEIAVIEMGMNHFGEMSRLAAMVRPDLACFTNIGDCHIEFLGSRQGILQAKTEMLSHLQPGGTVVFNGDDPLLRQLEEKKEYHVVSFGLGENCTVRGIHLQEKGMEGSAFSVVFDGKEEEFFVPAPGRHMVQNALAGIAVARLFGMDVASIRKGVAAYQPPEGRMAILKAPEYTIFSDAYNANPNSMQAALAVLSHVKGRKVCILGDMLELGHQAPAHHAAIGALAGETAEVVVCVGKLSKDMFDAAKKQPCQAYYFETRAQMEEKIKQLLQPGDHILVKASHGMQLDQTVQFLLS